MKGLYGDSWGGNEFCGRFSGTMPGGFEADKLRQFRGFFVKIHLLVLSPLQQKEEFERHGCTVPHCARFRPETG